VEVLGEDGLLDTTMDGPFHSLMLGWMKNVTCPVIKGRCELPNFPLPSMHGPWCGQICHTSYKNLKVDLQVSTRPTSIHVMLYFSCLVHLHEQVAWL